MSKPMTREQCHALLSIVPAYALRRFGAMLDAERREDQKTADELLGELGVDLADMLERAFDVTKLTIDDACEGREVAA